MAKKEFSKPQGEVLRALGLMVVWCHELLQHQAIAGDRGTGSQESQALGNFSAFAKAFADGLNGAADVNHDGWITLQELKTYSHNRTYQLLRQANNKARQDSTILWSRSMSANNAAGGGSRALGGGQVTV